MDSAACGTSELLVGQALQLVAGRTFDSCEDAFAGPTAHDHNSRHDNSPSWHPMIRKHTDMEYDPQETQQRFEAALRGA